MVMGTQTLQLLKKKKEKKNFFLNHTSDFRSNKEDEGLGVGLAQEWRAR